MKESAIIKIVGVRTRDEAQTSYVDARGPMVLVLLVISD